ncbi:MAG: TonB-dependent receptor [Steroidobacteraceae bacterium]
MTISRHGALEQGAPRHSAGRSRMLAVCVASIIAQAQMGPAYAQVAAPTTAGEARLEEIVVTGFRQSLANAADAKRESTNFTDSVFAEDIGKFPDLNIAEALNRIPGIQLTREITGEGLNIQIRGLGNNFTKVLLNGSQIGVASSGRTDATNQNREIDLDLFPTELFSRLDVSKTPTAGMVEGGVSGVVNMRTARPFDNPGTRFTYQAQASYGEESEDVSPRLAAMGSWTNDTFGVLVGIAGVHNKSTTTGFETIGWSNPTITNGQCGTAPAAGQTLSSVSAQCNSTGGNAWGLPGVNATTGLGVVPVNAGGGLVAGTTIDRAFLEAQNPGLSAEQIGNALIPRLGRQSFNEGTRDRVSGVISFEYRPSETMSFYLDTLYSDADREFDRIDMNYIGRNGAGIPQNLKIDQNNVVTSGSFANAQFFLEARPYDEEVDFYNVNPGAHFEFGENWILDAQANTSRSVFFRESPTILFNSPLNQGVTATIDNNGGDFPKITTNFDLNDPNAGWTWGSGTRVSLTNERRVTETNGFHLDSRFGNVEQNIKLGVAYDEISRSIVALDNSNRWQTLVCGGGPSALPADGSNPITAAACNGGPGSLIPNSALSSYIRRGPLGFITVDFDRFKADTNYAQLNATAPKSGASPTNAQSGDIEEKTRAAYFELNNTSDLVGHELRINAGARYVATDQLIVGPIPVRQAGTGLVLPGQFFNQSFDSDYREFLPSFNAALNVLDSVVTRFSASRTLTRANPSAMLPGTNFTDVGATNASQGNPNISPYLSTNMDLGIEWYTGREGYAALTLFDKKLTGFTVQGITVTPFLNLGIPFDSLTQPQQTAINSRGGPNNATVNVTRQENAGGTLNIRGYEAQLVQPLTFALDGLGFTANYTHVQQKSDGAGAPTQALGISPYTYNTTLYYENFGATVRLSYVYNAEQVTSVPNQQGIPLAQLYADEYGQWDLSASYEFTSLPTSPQLTLNVINLTGETQRATQQFDNATYTFYDPGYSIVVGLRGKF